MAGPASCAAQKSHGFSVAGGGGGLGWAGAAGVLRAGVGTSSAMLARARSITFMR